jgi:transaldolase
MDFDYGRTRIFADGADRDAILSLRDNVLIRGFTTNPTLMRAAGVEDYESFALDLVQLIPDRPISFEVFSDDTEEMYDQALTIASWGPHVHVKIPITDTKGAATADLQRRLATEGVRLNVTALLTLDQVESALAALADGPHAFISVFAGRIADTGTDPVPIMAKAVEMLAPYPNLDLIWASPREILNIVQAVDIGCPVITVTHALLDKLTGLGRDHAEVSLDTVRMFHRDARLSGYVLERGGVRIARAR